MTETSTTEPATRILDLAELKKHTSETDCYLLYNGKVYDVTEFLDEHPGGAMECCAVSDAGRGADGFITRAPDLVHSRGAALCGLCDAQDTTSY